MLLQAYAACWTPVTLPPGAAWSKVLLGYRPIPLRDSSLYSRTLAEESGCQHFRTVSPFVPAVAAANSDTDKGSCRAVAAESSDVSEPAPGWAAWDISDLEV